MAKLFGSSLEDEDVTAHAPKPLFADDAKKSPNIKNLVMEGRRKISDYEGIKDAPLPLSEISSSEVKEFLRERIGNLTIEGTVNEMYITIKNMETQLTKVLSINASLENDSKVTKETLIKVNKDNEELKCKIRNIEEDGPMRMELERELQQLIAEHNKKEEDIQDVKRENDKTILKMNTLQQEIARLEEEKDDMLKEASYLQSKADDLIIKLRDYEEHINRLKGENLYFAEKMKKQQDEVSDLVEARNAIQLELNECKEAFDEIYNALVETKINAKKFFYQGLKGEQEA